MSGLEVRRLRAAGAAWLLLSCCCLPAQPGRAGPRKFPAGKAQEIGRAVSAEMGRLGIPGLSLALANDLELCWSAGFGMADLENSVPARASTVYRLGSICKPITAVAVLQLSEKGKLDLDAPIQKYVPSFPGKDWPITARELLAHLSGIRHYRGLEEVNSTRHYSNLLEPLQIFEDGPLLFEPGMKFSYTSYGYNLLGAAVEGASGARFLDYLSEHIFLPAGMDRIRADSVYDIIPNRTRGYRKRPWGLENCALADTSNKIPSGGMISTPEDLVKFAVALDRGRLLSKRTMEEMFTQQHTRDGTPVPYGLGWRIQVIQGRKVISHSGAQQGVSTVLLNLPASGAAVAVMANLEGVDMAPLATRIGGILLR